MIAFLVWFLDYLTSGSLWHANTEGITYEQFDEVQNSKLSVKRAQKWQYTHFFLYLEKENSSRRKLDNALEAKNLKVFISDQRLMHIQTQTMLGFFLGVLSYGRFKPVGWEKGGKIWTNLGLKKNIFFLYFFLSFIFFVLPETHNGIFSLDKKESPISWNHSRQYS